MNGDFPVDLHELGRTIEHADVLSVYFPIIRRSLVVDTRCTAEDGPMVRIMAMVSSPEERARSVRRLRPYLPKPDKIAVIPWPRYVGSLQRLGVWPLLLRRLAATGFPDSVRACERALAELERYEREELAQVIRGDNYYTVWARRR